jgi:hypothetical protein
MVFPRRLVAPLLVLLTTLGCTTAKRITADGTLDLTPDQGILVVHIDSDFPIQKLKFNHSIKAATDLSAGTHLALFRVPAGRYRWTTIEIPAFHPGYFYRFRMRRDSEWKFEVKPGHITYPGQLVVKGSNQVLFGSGNLEAWTANRAAMALVELRANFPNLLAQHPMANGRAERDDFLDHYQQFLSSAPLGSIEKLPK